MVRSETPNVRATVSRLMPQTIRVMTSSSSIAVSERGRPVSRKAQNIAHEAHVVAHNGDGADSIIIKGRAERVIDQEELDRINAAYRDKYVDPHSGTKATVFVADDHVYRLRPRLVIAWSYATMTTRTDWRFAYPGDAQ
jgi:hypothetical protein